MTTHNVPPRRAAAEGGVCEANILTSKRLKHEKSPYSISYRTIYRAIYAGMFDTSEQKSSTGNRGAIRKLRHRGKPRRKKGAEDKRGKLAVSYTIHERPAEANNREVIGHWEADSVAGKRDGACLVTLTDRRSRYLLAEKVGNKKSEPFANKMIDIFAGIPAQSVCLLRKHRLAAAALLGGTLCVVNHA